jgi:hypothetical protein
MNFDQLFEPRLELIRSENRYRIFTDLERCAGRFPQAFDHRLQDQVTVWWCSNDCTRHSIGSEPEQAAHATFPKPAITMCFWKRACGSLRQGESAAFHLGIRRE